VVHLCHVTPPMAFWIVRKKDQIWNAEGDALDKERNLENSKDERSFSAPCARAD